MKPSRIKSLYYSAVAGFLGLLALFLGVSAHLAPNEGLSPADQAFIRAMPLSGQVTSLAGAYASGQPSARQQLTGSINALAALAPAFQPNAAPATPPAAGQGSAAATLDAFIARARAIAAVPPGAPVPSHVLAEFLGAAGAWVGAEQTEAVSRHARRTQHARLADMILAVEVFGLVLLMLAAQTLWLFRPLIKRMSVYTDEIVRLATTDALTGLANRRGFIERGELEYLRAQRYGRPLALLMLDADYFKRVNDTYGHDAGDEVLRSLARSFLQTLRQSDVVARLGGEEFAVLLPETDLNGAIYAAERIRIRVAGMPIKFRQENIRVTVSIGATTVNNKAGIEAALAEADELMYRAKGAGRNCVVASHIDNTDLPVQIN